MKKIIDMHTHAFPGRIVKKTMDQLEEEAGIKAALDGSVKDLLRSMNNNGIKSSVLASIATKPSQFDSILSWSKEIASDRIIPFPSLHPADPDALKRASIIADNGFKGIKLHPYYQNFVLNSPENYPLYRKIMELDLVILFHTGFDFAFDEERICDPEKISSLHKEFPDLKFIAAHMGGWDDWNEAEKYVIGKKIYIDISYSLNCMEREKALKMIEKHPQDYILFGSDSPWDDQGEALSRLKRLNLEKEREGAILFKNAERVLGLNTRLKQ